MSSCSPDSIDRKRAALLGLFVADATAMPVHWMYSREQLMEDYGVIRGYVKPKDQFQGSIMNLSNTGGGGRGSFKGDIIGDVINHGKKKYWGRGGNFHYHLGLQAGENTLEAQLTRLLIKTMTDIGGFSADVFRERYISFMRTPGSHNDTYASTCHRMFFANLMKGVPPEDCADNDGHNVDTIDALTLAVPVIVRYAEEPREIRNKMVLDAIHVIRRTGRGTDAFAIAYSDLLVDVLHGRDLREAIEEAGLKGGSSVKGMVERSIRAYGEGGNGDPMTACYIDSSYPALLFLAYKYASSVEVGIIANANAGGENVARGSVLGALLGAAHGTAGFPSWAIDGLVKGLEIQVDIQSLLPLAQDLDLPSDEVGGSDQAVDQSGRPSSG